MVKLKQKMLLAIRYFKMIYNKEIRKEIQFEYQWREQKISYGNENENKTFYIIRRGDSSDQGHFSMITYVLGHIMEALERNMIPIIDLKNHYSFNWQNISKKGKENAWEYFYEQPFGYTLEDVKNSKNIVLSRGVVSKYHPNPNNEELYYDDNIIGKYHDFYIKYIRLNKETECWIKEKEKEFQFDNKKVLAVAYRRLMEWGKLQDYEYTKYHASSPNLQAIIEKTKELMSIWKCDAIYLIIDDKEGAETFQNTFGSSLYCQDRLRNEYFKNGKPKAYEFVFKTFDEARQEEQEIKNLREASYLFDVYMMSKCNCLLSTKHSQTLGAYMLKGEGFRNVFFY